MEGKFLGLGLKNIVMLWVVMVLLTVMAKTIFAKYPVKGVSEIIHAV